MTKQKYGEVFMQLTKRHLLVFFKNKIRLLYTLMVPVIIFIVYIAFLRNLEISTVKNILADVGIKATKELSLHINTLIDSWMLSGITALSTFTVSLQTNSIAVCDKENGINRDFASSPIHRNILIGSYFLFNFIVTFAICFAFVLVCLVYLACMGEFCITFGDFMAMFGILAFSTIVATLFTVFICSFIRREPSLAGLIAVFSTALGFLMGAYMPLSQLPGAVQNLCAFFPGTYSCSLLRFSFMSTPMANISEYVLANFANGPELMAQLTGNFGYNLEFFKIVVEPGFQSLALSAFLLIFFALNVGFSGKLVSVLGSMMKKNKQKPAANANNVDTKLSADPQAARPLSADGIASETAEVPPPDDQRHSTS